MVNQEVLKLASTNEGNTLLDLSKNKSVLLVFLRHFGCIFCREALHDLSDMQHRIKDANVDLVMVCMSEPKLAKKYFNNYGFVKPEFIYDPEKQLYASFGLARGGASELLGLKNLIRGFKVMGERKAVPALRFIGDGFQMPGVFVLHQGKVIERFRHVSAADRPDYDRLLEVATNAMKS